MESLNRKPSPEASEGPRQKIAICPLFSLPFVAVKRAVIVYFVEKFPFTVSNFGILSKSNFAAQKASRCSAMPTASEVRTPNSRVIGVLFRMKCASSSAGFSTEIKLNLVAWFNCKWLTSICKLNGVCYIRYNRRSNALQTNSPTSPTRNLDWLTFLANWTHVKRLHNRCGFWKSVSADIHRVVDVTQQRIARRALHPDKLKPETTSP